MTRLLVALLSGVILGASFNEWAAQTKHEGIYAGLQITGNRMAEDYQEFAHKVAAWEQWQAAICADFFSGNGIRQMQRTQKISAEICP